MKIKILRNTAASGVSLSQGQVVSVPDEISESDAKRLIDLKKAALVVPEQVEEAPAEVSQEAAAEPVAQPAPKPEGKKAKAGKNK